MPFDSARFFYSLAGRLVASEWSSDGIRLTLREFTVSQGLRVPKLAERLESHFLERPSFKEIADFLRADRGLFRALSRGTRRYLRAGSKTPSVSKPPGKLAGIAIPKLSNHSDVARWLNISPRRLCWFADINGRNRRHPPGALRTYRYRWIARGDRFPRLLEIPKIVLKRAQRRILAVILDAVPTQPAAHGFCAGRSIVTNASAHCGKAIVLRFDLADFFTSITSARIFQIFRTIGYSNEVSRLLTGLCTTSLPGDVWEDRPGGRPGADFDIRQRLITRHLPQGAPTSPALANLAAHRLDRRLCAFARSINAAYTRYADDLTFSGDGNLARSRKWFADQVALIVSEEGFTLNFRKTRILRAGTRQQVTGVVVNVHPNFPRAEYDDLKAILTNCVRYGPGSQNRAGVADFQAHLRGRVAHAASINSRRAEKLKIIFSRIVWLESE